MNKRTRRTFSASFKAKVALEALRERNSIEEIARKHELHPTQVTTWKKEFISNAAAAFDGDGSGDRDKDQDEKIEKLYSQIGQLKVENDWLKKKLQ
jgi:transposase